MSNRGSKFGIGLVLGTLIGGAAAFFLSPKSGKENQELVKKKVKELQKFIENNEIEAQARKIFGDVTDKSKKISTQLQKHTKARMDELQTAVENVDVDKYKKQVAQIGEDLQKEGAAEDMINKAKEYLMSFIDRLADTAKARVDEVIPAGETEKKASGKSGNGKPAAKSSAKK